MPKYASLNVKLNLNITYLILISGKFALFYM